MNNHPLYKKLANYCGRAERSPMDVRAWLEKHEIYGEDAEEMLIQLEQEQLLSIPRYIHAYASDKLRFGQKGPIRIKYELEAQGLPSALIDAIVDDVMKEEEYLSYLQRHIEKRLALLGENISAEEIQQKVIRWAYNRGFSMEDILNTIKTLSS